MSTQTKKLIEVLKFKYEIEKEKCLKLKQGKKTFTIENIEVVTYINKNIVKTYLDIKTPEKIKASIKRKLNILFNRKIEIINVFMGYIVPNEFRYTNKGMTIQRKVKKKIEDQWEEIIIDVLISDKWIFITANVYSKSQYVYQAEVKVIDPKTNIEIIRVCNRDVLAKSQSCLTFLSNELNVNIEDGKKADYSKFFFDFYNLNKENLKKKITNPTLGWNEDNTKFAPYSDDIHLDFSNDKYNFFKKVAASFKISNNNLSEFKKRMFYHTKNPYADFIISCSFAAPLLKVVGVRSFLLNCYGPSKYQKSLSARIGLSAFGNWKHLEMSGNDTTNVIRAKINKLQNVICYIDEIVQKGQKYQNVINGYDFGSEKDRHRLDKNSEIKEAKTWQTIGICTSETSIQKDTDMSGEINRSLYLSVDCRPDELKNSNDNLIHRYAQDYYRFLQDNYGYFGKAYIEEVVRLKPNLPKWYSLFTTNFYNKNNNNNLTEHISSIAITCLGNYIYRRFIYNIDDINYSINLGNIILNKLQNQDELDPRMNFLNCMYNFYEMNKNSFIIKDKNSNSKQPSQQIYGVIDMENEEIIFILNPLKDYLIKSGFDWNFKTDLIKSKLVRYQNRRINGILGKRIIISTNREDIEEEVYKNYEQESKKEEAI